MCWKRNRKSSYLDRLYRKIKSKIEKKIIQSRHKIYLLYTCFFCIILICYIFWKYITSLFCERNFSIFLHSYQVTSTGYKVTSKPNLYHNWHQLKSTKVSTNWLLLTKFIFSSHCFFSYDLFYVKAKYWIKCEFTCELTSNFLEIFFRNIKKIWQLQTRTSSKANTTVQRAT